jgi:DNA polymerase-3 subunit epsilon
MRPRLQDRVRRRDVRGWNRPNSAAVIARERAIGWAREVVADPSVVYLDTETTGLDGQAEIVDIAVVSGDGKVLLDTLVRPVRRIPLVASGVHGIRDADVAGAPTWEEVFQEFGRVTAGRRIVVYNADFDRRIVAQCCDQYALAFPESSWQCAMRAYAEFCAEPGRSGGFKWHRLDLAASRFGVSPGGHRALADAIVCRLVVSGMAQLRDESDEADAELREVETWR